MGSRRVLGNDPFQRGAAERTPATTRAPGKPDAPAEDPRAREPAPGAAPRPPPAASAPVERAGGASRKRPPTKAAAPRPGKAAAPAEGRAAPRAAASPAPGGKRAPPTHPLAAGPGSAGGPAPALPQPAEPLPGPPLASSRPPASPPEPPPAPGVPTLTWTPLPTAAAPMAEPPPREPDRGVEAPDASAATPSASLVEALREAPGLLAEAWSALEAAGRAIRAGLGTAGAEQLDVYGRDARLSEALAPLLDFLYSRWFRVEVEGAGHVPTGGALLVANHAGALPLDGPMLHEALLRERPELPEARWLAEDQVFYAPVLGTLFNRLGAVRASPDSATRLLAEGRPVLIFPEGIQGIGKPFRDRYRLQRFGRGGFVKLALRTGRPILPVAIMGAEETLPLLGKLPGGLLGVPYVPVTPLGPLPLPAKWRIRIGEPIAVPPGARETDLSAVESMVEATRNTIEHMLRELLGARGGVFLG